jgi:hypothetical protein
MFVFASFNWGTGLQITVVNGQIVNNLMTAGQAKVRLAGIIANHMIYYLFLAGWTVKS